MPQVVLAAPHFRRGHASTTVKAATTRTSPPHAGELPARERERHGSGQRKDAIEYAPKGGQRKIRSAIFVMVWPRLETGINAIMEPEDSKAMSRDCGRPEPAKRTPIQPPAEMSAARLAPRADVRERLPGVVAAHSGWNKSFFM